MSVAAPAAVVLKVVTSVLTALWPLIICAAVMADVWRSVLPILALVLGLRIILGLKARPSALMRAGITIAGLALGLCLLSLTFSSIGFMFYYPVAVNLVLLIVFAHSLRGAQSIVERLARLQDPELSPRGVRYTRKVTQAWCVFFALNGTIAAVTAVIGDLKLWTWWNGLLSYGAMGLMFGGEYLLRRRLQAKERAAQDSAASERAAAPSEHAPAAAVAAQGLTQGSDMPVCSLATWLNDERIIATDGTHCYTTAQARACVTDLRAQLTALPTAQRVALVLISPYSFTLAFLAVLSLGRRPVILGHHNASLVASQTTLFDAVITDLPALSCARPVLTLEQASAVESAEIWPALNAIPSSACFELFTSGSTGTPKAVVKTVGEMEAEARLLAAFLGPQLQQSTLLTTVFPYHMYGLTFSVFLPLSTKTPLHLPQIHYSEELAARTAGRYLLISSPAFLKRLDFTLPAPQLTAIVSAGGPLALRTRQQLHAWCGLTPTEIYGSTEAGVMAHRAALSDEEPFTLFSDVSMEIGPKVSLRSGHVATALTLDDKVEPVGARGIRLLGRSDRIVKIEEKRVSLSAIEVALTKLPGISAAAALVVKRGGRDLIGAAVVSDKVTAPTLLNGAEYVALRRNLAAVLEPYALPRIVLKVPALPETALGKRDSRALAELFATKAEPSYNDRSHVRSQGREPCSPQP